jgi:hypothetical protein
LFLLSGPDSQVYNGRPALGVLLFGAVAAATGGAIAILLYLPSAPLNLVLALLLFLGVWLAVLVHGALGAARAVEIELRRYHRWHVFLGVIGLWRPLWFPRWSRKRSGPVPTRNAT